MRPKKSISCEELIKIIPKNLLRKIAQETKINYSVSKLTGENMFSLLLYGLISEKEVSLKILQAVFESPLFLGINQTQKQKINKSALSYRLKNMRSDYFKKVFDHLAEDKRVNQYLGIVDKKYLVKKVDSTIVTFSSKLLKIGMNIFAGRKDLKFSTAIADGLPIEIELFTKKTYASENKALKEIINRKRAKQRDKITILVFDRGIHNRDIFEEIVAQPQAHFVTRLTHQAYKVDRINKIIQGRKAGKLILSKDEIIHFESKKEKRLQPYRLITALDPKTKKEYQFLTSILFLKAKEICSLYKDRWEIETFFKFLKQQLNFRHLISRSENGIKIVMYMTMIAATLIAIYKRINKIETWGSAKRKFIYELEDKVLEIFFPYYASKWGYVKKTSLILDNT